MSSMENPQRVRRVRNPQSSAGASSHRGDRGHGMSSKPSGKGKKLPFPQDTCYRCGKGRHQKVQDCKALDMTCRGCGKKGHFEKVCLKKHSTHSLEVPQASNTSTAGAGASEPLYFDDGGQPVYTYMVSVPHANKHLIKFPIALDYLTLRDRTGHSNCTEYGAWHTVWSQIGSHQCCMCSNPPGASWPRISSLEDASYCKGGASQLHPSITAY